MICVVCGLAFSADAQRWDVEGQNPGDFLYAYMSAAIDMDDFVAVGANGGLASRGRVFRVRNGVVLWSKDLLDNTGTCATTTFAALQITTNGDIVVVGGCNGLGYRGLITRLDPDGNLLWTTAVNVSGEAVSFYSLTEAPDGSFYAVGRSGMAWPSNAGVTKLSAAGDVLWMKDYSVPGEYRFVNAQMHSDTLLALERPIWAPGISGLALSKFAPDGTFISRRWYDTGNPDKASSMVSDGSGGYVITFNRFGIGTGMLHVDQNLEPIGQTILVTSTSSLEMLSAVFNGSTNECTLLGGANNGAWFAAALCVSLNSFSMVWERTILGTGTFTSGCPGTVPNAILATGISANLSANGSLSSSIFLLNLSTGENTIGPACELSEPILPTVSQEPVTFTDEFPTERNLVPEILHDFSLQDASILITPCTPILLPVTWLNWQAEAVPDGIHLSWNTASETNNDRYIIERSMDPDEWANIGEIPVTANTIGRTNYVWKDEFPNVGTNYYRLRQMDKDGTYDLTAVQAVQWSGSEQGPLFYPNPVASEQVVRAQEMVVVMDLLGKQVQGPTLQFQAPQQPGLYLVRGKTRVEQLVVH